MNTVLNTRSFKRMDEGGEVRTHYALVPVKEIPAIWDEWIEGVNPRSYDEHSPVTRAIWDTLTGNPSGFSTLNRGIILMVQSVSYNQPDGVITVELEDKSLHGIADGGQTYRTIRKYLNNIVPEDIGDDAWVRFEIVTGIQDRNKLIEFVEARNNNVKVKLVSKMNMEKKFDGIKEATKNELYGGHIAYEENAE